MKIIKYKILMFVLIAQTCLGQDSIRVESEISIETKGQHNLAFSGIKKIDCWHCNSGKINDNPFFHLAIYTGINYKVTLDNKYTLETGLFLEERSHSGGNNTLANLVVFPKILLNVKDTIKVYDKIIGVNIKGGDLWDEDIGDMLRFYNIDYQGIIGELVYNKWRASFMSIGDLSNNIGLDLHQTYRFALGYKNSKVCNQTSFTINELLTFPRGSHPTSNDINIANYFKYELTNDLNIESQIETRINRELPNSVALGLKINFIIEKIKISSSARYFSSQFNFGYNGDQPNYTNSNGGFVGNQLYPLKNFYRNYSQWAAYTHLGSSDLIGIEFTALWDKKIYHKFGLFYDVDLNYIYNINSRKGIMFPIYNTGIQLYFLSNFNVKFSLTNKHMELSKNYQTFALSKSPFLSLGVHMNLDKIRLRTLYIKP